MEYMALTKDDKEWIRMALEPIKKDTENIDNRLNQINGKVGKHEVQIDQALLERGGNREMQRHEFAKLNLMCKKVEHIDSTLMEYKMIKRYPKIFMFMASCFIIWMGWEIVQNFILHTN